MQCYTNDDPNCLNPSERQLKPCDNPNHKACVKYYNLYLNTHVVSIYRTCAAKQFDDRCYVENNHTNNPHRVCMYWCSSDSCNRSSRQLTTTSSAQSLVAIILAATAAIFLMS